MPPDIAARVEATFQAAVPRMQGLPIVNPQLAVAAVDFLPWAEHTLGVLVTPWCLNLILLPRVTEAWVPLTIGSTRRFAFPAGDFDFVGATAPELGAYAMCSLFSPVHEFADQATAIAVARAARAALLDPANAPAPAVELASVPTVDAQATVDVGPTAVGSLAVLAPLCGPPTANPEPAVAARPSRRDLLRGRLHRSRGDPGGTCR